MATCITPILAPVEAIIKKPKAKNPGSNKGLKEAMSFASPAPHTPIIKRKKPTIRIIRLIPIISQPSPEDAHRLRERKKTIKQYSLGIFR